MPKIEAPAAERSLIACVLRHGPGCVLGASDVSREDFADATRSRIWGAARALSEQGRPITLTTLADQAAEEGGDPLALAAGELDECIGWPSRKSELGEYAATVLDRSSMRRFTTGIRAMLEAAPAATTRDLADRIAAAAAMASAGVPDEDEDLGSLLATGMAQLRRVLDGGPDDRIGFGLPQIDLTARPGDLIVLAARPAVGKSSLAGQAALHVARRYGPVLFATLEMTAQSVAERLASCISGTPLTEVMTGRSPVAYRAIEAGAREISDVPLKITAKLRGAGAIRAAAQRTPDLKLLVVDYLQLVSPPPGAKNRTREREVGEISRLLKLTALDLGIPVLALSQFNRAGEFQPTLANLRDSGSLEQDADQVWFLMREEEAREATLKVAKNRSGPCGSEIVPFNPGCVRFG